MAVVSSCLALRDVIIAEPWKLERKLLKPLTLSPRESHRPQPAGPAEAVQGLLLEASGHNRQLLQSPECLPLSGIGRVAKLGLRLCCPKLAPRCFLTSSRTVPWLCYSHTVVAVHDDHHRSVLEPRDHNSLVSLHKELHTEYEQVR